MATEGVMPEKKEFEGIPQNVYLPKISSPTKDLLDAIAKKDSEGIVRSANRLIAGIDWVMQGPWINPGIFHGLNELYQWVYQYSVKTPEEKIEKPEEKPNEDKPTKTCYSFPPSN